MRVLIFAESCFNLLFIPLPFVRGHEFREALADFFWVQGTVVASSLALWHDHVRQLFRCWLAWAHCLGNLQDAIGVALTVRVLIFAEGCFNLLLIPLPLSRRHHFRQALADFLWVEGVVVASRLAVCHDLVSHLFNCWVVIWAVTNIDGTGWQEGAKNESEFHLLIFLLIIILHKIFAYIAVYYEKNC